MVQVTNKGTNPRGIHDRRGHVVVIGPGQTREISLSDEQIAARQSAGGQIVVDEDSVRRVLNTVDKKKSSGSDTLPLEDVLAHVNDKEYNFKTASGEAAAALGDKWPGGNQKRKDIVELLEAEIAAQKQG